VGVEVRAESGDALGEERDLDFGGAGVLGVTAELGQDPCLFLGAEGHSEKSFEI
jgi:hypothetical protein